MSKEIKKEKSFSFFLRWVILISSIFALATPLVFSTRIFYPFVGPKGIYFILFSQIAFFSWLLLAVHDRNFLPRKNIVVWGVSLYVLSIFIISFFGVNFYNSFWSTYERMTGLLIHLHLLGFFIATSSVLKKTDWRILLFSNGIFASIVSIVSLYDRFIGIDIIDFVRGSTTGNTSFLGTYLLLSVFLAFYLLFKDNRYLSGIIFSIISLGIILNPGGRAAFVSFISGIILFFLLWLFFEKKGFLRIISAILISIGIILSLFGLYIVLTPSGQITEEILSYYNLGSIGGRTIVWEISKEAFLEKPLLGWGAENFQFGFIGYYNPCLGIPECGNDTYYDRAHNFIYDNIVSFGIVGLFFYIILFLSPLFFLWKRYIKEEKLFIESSLFTSLFAAYLIQNLTVFDVVGSLVILFFIFAFISSLSKERDYDLEKTKEVSYIITAIILFAFLLYFIIFVLNPYKGSSGVISSFRADAPVENKLEIADNAIYASPLGRGQIRKSLALRVLSSKETGVEGLEETSYYIDELKEGIEINPLDYNSYVLLGRLYLRYSNLLLSYDNTSEEIIEKAKKSIKKADEIFQRAIEVSPGKQNAYWYLGEAKVRQGEKEEGYSFLEKSVQLEPRNFQSQYYLIMMIDRVFDDEDLLMEKIKEAKEINPDWEFNI